MNIMYIRTGYYMPSINLQRVSIENNFKVEFDKVVIEDISSLDMFKKYYKRDEIYVYRPECLFDITYDEISDMLDYYENIMDAVHMVELSWNDKTQKSLSECLLISLFTSIKLEKESGTFDDSSTIDLHDKFPFQDSIHQCADNYNNGEYYVYMWVNYYEDVFYVGSGKGNRYACVGEGCRSSDFMTVYDDDCKPYIVAYGMSEKEARDYEKNLIKAYIKLGFHLVNRKDNNLRTTKITDSSLIDERRYMSYWK